MYAHRDASILDALAFIQWEAVEIEQRLDPEGKVEDIYIVHEKGTHRKMRQLVWFLRNREQNVGRSLLQTSLFILRPVGTGRTDVDFSSSHQ